MCALKIQRFAVLLDLHPIGMLPPELLRVPVDVEVDYHLDAVLVGKWKVIPKPVRVVRFTDLCLEVEALVVATPCLICTVEVLRVANHLLDRIGLLLER